MASRKLTAQNHRPNYNERADLASPFEEIGLTDLVTFTVLARALEHSLKSVSIDLELNSIKNKSGVSPFFLWRVPKEKGKIILCRECPEPRRKEKKNLGEPRVP